MVSESGGRDTIFVVRHTGRFADDVAPPPVGGIQTRLRTAVGDGVIMRMDLLLRLSSFLNRNSIPVTMSMRRDAVDLALNLPEQGCVISSDEDTALPVDPGYNLVNNIVVSYR